MALYQVFTTQNYPYLQKHSGVSGTEIATLKRAFLLSLWEVDAGVNPLGLQVESANFKVSWV